MQRCVPRRALFSAGSGEYDDVAVLRQPLVDRYQFERLGQRLSDQEPVERVIVVGRKVRNASSMRCPD
jgi:hypothetical protein